MTTVGSSRLPAASIWNQPCGRAAANAFASPKNPSKRPDPLDSLQSQSNAANEGPAAIHRVFEEGKPKFQLRKGEEGLSVFDADVISPQDILPSFRPGSRLTTQQREFLESRGFKIRQTPGDDNLPQILRDNHYEIGPGGDMTRNQFKAALKRLEEDCQ